VEEILSDEQGVTGVRVGEVVIHTRFVILATGGSSYPQTGTTGDGYALARTLGHTVVSLRPALAPMSITPALPREWRGVAIRGSCLSAIQSGRRIATWNGDLLITHEGLSGPAALEVSRAAAVAAEVGPVILVIDFLPDMTRDATDLALLSMIRTQGSRMISTLLEPWLPNRLIDRMLRSAGVDPTTRGHALTRETRRMVLDMLKAWTIGTVASIPIERGEVTAGGVALNEVDPRTMQSRRVKGLYFCGEVLDVAGPVGGYNLQAAFSTGYVAGASAAGSFLAGK
jgi:predicted Rossmann fold flavoprotein